jgi:hypothetical protein
MVTGWSWFGTNQLQVGLHSYGFSNTLAVGLVVGWLLHAAVLVLGLLPLRWWASYNALTAAKLPAVEELTAAKLPAVEEDARRPAPSIPKSRGKRGSRRGDPSYFPGPA